MKFIFRIAKATGFSAFLVLMASSGARAGDDPFWDELSRYGQRIDTISVASGDARNANAVTQIINPWPVRARDRRIPANGERMVGVINGYLNRTSPGAKPSAVTVNLLGGGSGGGGGGGQ